MTHDEYFQFMRETAKIEIDIDTGFAYVPVNSFRAGERGAIESIELKKLVNATIELCKQSIMNNMDVLVTQADVFNTFEALKVK